MITQKKELNQEQQNQVAKWKNTINTYEAKDGDCFSSSKIQEVLDEIQDFIRQGLPDHLFVNIQKVTDAIFEASLVLAETEKNDEHHRKASRLLCLAIKELCK